MATQVNMRTVWTYIFVALVVCTCSGVSEINQTPALNPGEQYQDLFPLTKDNFTDSVLRNNDPWIVIAHDGTIDKGWKTTARDLRGLCWFGLIDRTKENLLLEKLKYGTTEVAARVFPYGNKKTKLQKSKDVKNQNEARDIVLQSLPDRTQRLSRGNLPDFLLDAFTSSPSRFPAYLILDSEKTPDVLKMIALRFERYFLFGKMVNPSMDDLAKMGLGNLEVKPPELFVMVTQGRRPESLDAIRFDQTRHGAMNYTSVLQFLFQINTDFRHELPGANMVDDEAVAGMSDILNIEAKRFEIVGDKHNFGTEPNIRKYNAVHHKIKKKTKTAKEDAVRGKPNLDRKQPDNMGNIKIQTKIETKDEL